MTRGCKWETTCFIYRQTCVKILSEKGTANLGSCINAKYSRPYSVSKIKIICDIFVL
jgi:hypothetical protein